MLANLDNEVIFKKAFTDKIVFTAFVKDVLGIDIEVDKIETEKRFKPKIGNIDFKLDIFAESTDDRVIVEIQRIEYDYNFDRFLHYFLMSIAELQRGFKKYGIDKTVYGIVVMTAAYTILDKTGRAVKDEVMISELNPKNLKGEEICIFNHRLVFLNSYHKDDSTPKEIRDWLDLFYESIHNPEHPRINLKKEAIKRAAEIIDEENISPEEWEAQKLAESAKVARQVRDNVVREETTAEMVAELLKMGILTEEQIAKAAKTTVELVKSLREKLHS